MLGDRAWILQHIPHSGTMCLLDRVLEWDDEHAVCGSEAHRSADNPLRAEGRLTAACGIEFATQAIAVHGALLAAPATVAGRIGYIASLRGVELHADRLDDIEESLIASAWRVGGDEGSVLYRFSLSARSRTLLKGRAVIVLDTARR